MTFTEYAVVELHWRGPEEDGPPLWGWGDLEEARRLLAGLPAGPGEWHIVERDVTVSGYRPTPGEGIR